jgi:hypothetical protein
MDIEYQRMKKQPPRIQFFLGFFLLLLSMLVPACSFSPEEQAAAATSSAKETQLAEIGPTAVFETAVALKLTENAPPPSQTPTQTLVPSPTTTPTSTPTITPEPTESPEPTSENPWVLQASCDGNPNCNYIEANNRTAAWLQIYLTNLETGDSGFFSIGSQSTGKIWITNGQYWVDGTWYCGNLKNNQRFLTPANANLRLWARCPDRFLERQEVPH